MTTTDKLRKHYDVLSHRERLALLMEAMEREDETEMRSLWQTVPVKTFRLSDPAFTGAFEGMMDVAMVLSGIARDCTIRLLLLLLERERHKTDPPEEDEEKKLLKTLDAVERVQAQGKGAMRAFETICREHGFDKKKVLAASHCPLPDL
nr:hypothetical protein [Nitrospiraceae bacterium]